jgi:hypothetical protein
MQNRLDEVYQKERNRHMRSPTERIATKRRAQTSEVFETSEVSHKTMLYPPTDMEILEIEGKAHHSGASAF